MYLLHFGDSDNVKWELDLTGDGNDFNTFLRKTQTNHWLLSIVVMMETLISFSNLVPLQGVTSCSGVINLDITSDDATITINQKDTSD